MDDFEQAFNESTDGDATVVVTTRSDVAPPVNNDGAPAPAPASVADDHESGFDDSAPAATPAPAPAQATETATTAPATAPADDEDPAKLRQKLRTLQGIAAKQGEDMRAAAALIEELKQKATPPATAPAPAPAENSEDDELLAELEEASPTVAKAMRALIKKERQAMEKEVETRVSKRVDELTGQIAPLREKADTQAAEEHFATIEKAHNGWESVVASDEFVAWAQKQPAGYRNYLAGVAKEGSAEDVIGVLDYFRAAHPAPKPSTTPPVDDKRTQQMAALGSIPSRSTPVQTRGVDKDDFDAGFNDAR